MNPNRGYRKANLPENAKRVFEGKIFDVYQWEQELYDGSKAIFEKLTRPDTVVVIPVLEGEQILLIEDSQPHRGAILTLPAGRVEEGETLEEAARRELLEETGHAVDSLELLSEQQVTGKLDWNIYTFIGRRAKKVQDAAPEAGEKIALRPVSFEVFLEAAATEKILRTDTASIALEAKVDPKKMGELKKKLFG